MCEFAHILVYLLDILISFVQFMDNNVLFCTDFDPYFYFSDIYHMIVMSI